MQLTEEFGEGFDVTNLRRMRRFYQAFPIRDALRPELNFTHYRLLIRVKNQAARNYYLQECIEGGWSTRQNDNPTIGIILCSKRSENIVRYSVLAGSETLFASKYKAQLPTIEELEAELARERRLLEGE